MSDASTLPAALQPWHHWLSWFEPELAAEVGRMVQRLHPLLGRFRGHRQGGEPEPDGLGDLRQRGPYERLLATEWLLADELPDEFLRRAATHEHLFLAPRPRARRAERLIVALFDAGPLQFGAPRLAHLALWILLARRATEAGGELRWGVMQSPAELHEAVTAHDLLKLLRSRCFAPADASHWQQWQQAFADQALALGECWLIGPELLEASRDSIVSHQLALQRRLQDDVLEVSIAERSTRRSLDLPLPGPAAAVPLLKGRFLSEAPVDLHQQVAHRTSLQRPPIVAPGGRHIAVQQLDAPGALIFHVPANPEAKRANTRRQQWSRGVEPIACVFSGKQFAALMADNTHLFFWQMPKFGVRERPPREVFEAPPGTASWLPSVWLRGKDECLCVIDRAGRLLRFPREARHPTEQVDTGVIGFGQTRNEALVYATIAAGQVWLRTLNAKQAPGVATLLGAKPENDPLMLFCTDGHWPHGRSACAMRTGAESQETWRFFTAHNRNGGGFDAATLTLPPGLQGIGLACRTEGRLPRHGLIALAGNRSSLYWFDMVSSQAELLYTAPARIAQYGVCPESGLVALLTVERHVIAFDPIACAPRLFVHTTAEGHDAPA